MTSTVVLVALASFAAGAALAWFARRRAAPRATAAPAAGGAARSAAGLGAAAEPAPPGRGDGLAAAEPAAGDPGRALPAERPFEIDERALAAEETAWRAGAPAREGALGGAEAPEPSPAEARRRRAELRMPEALQSPRRVPDLVRGVVALLFEGLGADRCYAVEVDGLRALPVAHERRSEAAAPVSGLDLGRSFVDAVGARAGPTVKAVALDAARAAELVVDPARARLGPVSRMAIPVWEKGRVVLVFVAEWIDLAKRWADEDVALAERLVARAAVARERILQAEALAGQAAHAREERERVEQALERLQAIVDAVPDALVGLDDEGRVTFANRAASRLAGRAEFELVGLSLAELADDLGPVEAAVVSDAPSGPFARVLSIRRREGARS